MNRLNVLARCAIAAGVAMVMASVTLVAHHSFAAEFDANKPIKVKGVLDSARLVNPHGWLYIQVSDDAANGRLVPPSKGKTVLWGVEMGGANGLYRRGWRAKDLPKGRVVVVEGFMAKDGSAMMNGVCITFEDDGKTLFTGGSAGSDAFKGTGLAGSKPCGGQTDDGAN
jgi:hypothetical protein